MSSVKSQEASSSASPSRYHVFLSFRGEDTGKTFTDHLCTALDQAGFRTFRNDDHSIEKGKDIKSEIEKAIRDSRMSIIVFSKNYASSTWCLEELVMILKQRTSGHVVLPIFYDVHPSEMRKQTGIFADAFARHEDKLKSETSKLAKEILQEKIGTWRAALREVANLTGMDLQNQVDGHEARFIKEIIKVVGGQLSHKSLNSAPNLIETLYVNAVQYFNWPWPRLRKLVGISPLFSRAELLHVWPGLNFWYYLAIISSPAWVFSILAMDFIKKTTDLVFIFLISTLALSCFAINFMLSQFYFSLPSIPETDRFFRGYQRAGKTIGYTLLFFGNVGLYYFTEKSVACILTFLFLAFYCLCALFCIQSYTDFGALKFLLSACMNQTLSHFGIRSSYSWVVIIACIVIAGIRFCLEPAEATTDEVDLESGCRNTYRREVNATCAAHPLPDVNATDVAHDAGKVNLESMPLVLFKDNNKVLEAIRCSRSLQQSCIPEARGTVFPGVEVNPTRTSFLNLGVGLVGHQLSFELPLVHSRPPSPMPIQPHVESSLCLVPYNKKLHHQNKAEKVVLSNKPPVNIDPSKEAKKAKRKVKYFEDILGIPKATGTRKGGRRRKQKCVVFRSALAAAALSVSTEGINNRNIILLNESQAVRTVTKIMGTDYFGNDDEEVISSIMVTDEEELLRSSCSCCSPNRLVSIVN